MRAPASTTMLCRVLLGLDRARATGTLFLQGEGRRATLCLEDGLVVAANVDRRVASSHRQLLESMLGASGWEGLVLRFAPGPFAVTWWKLAEPTSAQALSLPLLRAATKRVDIETIRADLGDTVYHLTASGDALMRGIALRPEETAAVVWLRRGVSAEDVPTLPGCGVAGYRFVWMLKLLRCAAPKSTGSYPLLLRKRREVRERASARALLDLPEDARGQDARRALRKLVRDLHPDRFGEGAPPALRRASGEIVTALVDAEALLASGATE